MTDADQHDPAQGGIVPPGLDLVTVTLGRNQWGLIVVSLMEASRGASLEQQMDLSRLALGLNDILVGGEDDEHAEPG